MSAGKTDVPPIDGLVGKYCVMVRFGDGSFSVDVARVIGDEPGYERIRVVYKVMTGNDKGRTFTGQYGAKTGVGAQTGVNWYTTFREAISAQKKCIRIYR